MAANPKKRPKTTKKKKSTRRSGISYSAAAAIVFVTGVVLGIFTYSPTSTGVVGEFIKLIMKGLFSSVAYLVPPVVLGLSAYVVYKKSSERLVIKLATAFICLVLSGSLLQLFTGGEMPQFSQLWELGLNLKGGGVLGSSVAICLDKLFGTVASVIIVLAVMFLLLSMMFKISIVSAIVSFFAGFGAIRDEFEDINDVDTSDSGKKIKEKIRSIGQTNSVSEPVDSTIAPLHGVDLAQLEDIGTEKETKRVKLPARKPKKKLAENQAEVTANTASEEIDFVPVNGEQITFDANKFLDDVAAQLPMTEGVKELLEEQKKQNQGEETPQKASKATAEELGEVSKEIDDAIAPKVKEYKYPSLELLNKPSATNADKKKEVYMTATRLIEILKNFGVDAKLLQVTTGPTVTRYEIQPSTGVKLSKITGLAEDIALNLAVPTVLVAAVPGKAAVGIEVPNTSVGTVTARELLESDEFKNGKSKLTIALGRDIAGKVVIGDIAKFPHVLIAGATGAGKSVCINTIITSILYKASPDEVKLIMIDPKVVELGVYNGIPHLLIPVVTDPKRAAGSLNWAVGEMMSRYALFAETGTRNLQGYNAHLEKEGKPTLPQIVIIIDELADLMMVAAKEVEDYICRLAQLARAAGIHLIIATQRPSVDVITGLIKANVPSRIAFAVSSGVDSRTILDKIGAEKLLGKGDMLYHPTGLPNALRVQGAFVSDEEIERVIDFIKANSEETHYSEDLAEHIERVSTGENGVTDKDEADDADVLLPDAINLALELGQISTSMVQRKLKVGYSRAGRIVDQMESRGLIGPADGSKPREVYQTRIASLQSGISEEMLETND